MKKKNRAAGRLARQEALIQRIATAVWASQPKVDYQSLHGGAPLIVQLPDSSHPSLPAEALSEYRRARLS